MRWNRVVVAHALACLVGAPLVLAPSDARAEWALGLDASGIVPLREPETNLGVIGGAHFGYRFDLRTIKLGPEIGGNFGVFTPEANARKTLLGGYVGARMTLEIVPSVIPYAYAHLGFGVAESQNLPDPNAREKLTSGAFVDLAVGVGRRFAPPLFVGLEAGYGTIEPGRCFCARWVHAGISAELGF